MSNLELIVDYIECENGWQAEVAINVMWVAHTKVLPTKEQCVTEYIKLTTLLGCNDGG